MLDRFVNRGQDLIDVDLVLLWSKADARHTVLLGAEGFVGARGTLKSDRRDEFLKVMQQNLQETMKEGPHSIQFLLGEDVDTPNVFYLHEEYQTQDDHRTQHSKTQHYDACMKFFATEPFVEPHVADEFTLLHDPPSSPLENHANTFCLNVKLVVKPEYRDEFLKWIWVDKHGADNDEPLCRQFTLGESIHSPNAFYLHEEYQGLAGFQAHQASPHYAEWSKFSRQTGDSSPFAKPPTIQKYMTIVE